jgi:hypothetical protein
MVIYLALCGNKYSESLAKAYTSESELTLIHRSNVRFFQGHLLRILVLFIATVLRYFILPINRGKFILLAPHIAGSYGFLIRLLKPHQCILMDDGITFEYWTNFHNEYILPLYLLPETFLLLGPHPPNWNTVQRNDIEFKLIDRRRIVCDILSQYKFSLSNGESIVPKVRMGWLVDDGQMDDLLINNLLKLIGSKYGCQNVAVLWHPARSLNVNMAFPNRPAEASILCAHADIGIVFGKVSTTLFNIVAYSPNINVASLPSGYPDLDQSAKNSGIVIINAIENVEN